jgi:hypothetical protein
MSKMSETSPDRDKTPLFGVDWLKAVAGALAAVSTTVLLSTLGAAGTLLGAALGSLAATVATALYSQGLDRSRTRVRELSRLGGRPVPIRNTPFDDAAQDGSTVPSTGSTGSSGSAPGWRERLRAVSWRRPLLGAAALFLVVLVAVTAFELISGRTLASAVRGGHSGGTTLSHVTGTGGGTHHRSPSPTRGSGPTESPSTTATPSATPSPTASPSATPSEEPSGSPSAQPSGAPSESIGSTPAPTQSSEPAIGSSPSVPAGAAPGE